MENDIIAHLITLLSEAALLCEVSGYEDSANWFRDRIRMIKNPTMASFPEVLDEIGSVLAGMGSFSDLSLTPSANSGISREQARLCQWVLVEEIGQAIESLKKQGESTFNAK